MGTTTNLRGIESRARAYVQTHSSLRYEDIVAHADKESQSADDRTGFADAVLKADIVESNECVRANELATTQIKFHKVVP